MAEARTRRRAHEPREVDLGAIALGAALIVAALALAIAAAYVAIAASGGASRMGSAARSAAPSSAWATTLQRDPAADIAAYRAEKRKQLETYGWVDRERRIVRIPIERAMALRASGASPAP